MTEVLEAALAYVARGWCVVPIKPGEKRPEEKNWQKLRLSPSDLAAAFRPGFGVGVLLGQPSQGLIDIDLDAREAAFLAPRFLPPTPAIFGRASKEESHWLYTVEVIPSTSQHESPAPEGAMLVEMRSTGGQTVFPPSVHPSGEGIEWSSAGDPARVDAAELLGAVKRLAAASLLAKAWPSRGARNNTALALAGGLLRGGWDVEHTTSFIVAVAEAAGDEEVEDRTLSINATKEKLDQGTTEVTGWNALGELIGIATDKGTVEGKAIVSRVLRWLSLDKGTTIGGGLDRTDLGNARRLSNLFGEDLKWSPEQGWLVWDDRRWRSDAVADALVLQRSEKVVEEIVREALAKNGDEEKKKHLSWAIQTQSAGHLASMVDVARRQERILVREMQGWDQGKLLLNCQNGTLDLETGELREHRRDDLITRITAADYDPKARSKDWEKLLRDATGGDADMIEFLQRAAGYSLTGMTDEEKLFFVHGPTASGKSSFVEALKATLGDYASTTDFETFLAKKGDAGARNDIARLARVRMVCSVEVEDGRKIAEALVKTLTGGDVISARFLYKELFEFRPQFKLWLVANHKPRVDNDSAIWRRILVVPFEHTVPEKDRDPMLKRRLVTPLIAGSAILAWAVEGYARWARDKELRIPERVIAATDAYREEQDRLKDFFEEVCTLDPGNLDLGVPKSDLRERYVSWCKRNGSWPISEVAFRQRLLDLGMKEKKSGSVRGWLGISLLAAAEREF